MADWIDRHRRPLVELALLLVAGVLALFAYEKAIGPLPGEGRIAEHFFARPVRPAVREATAFVIYLGSIVVVALTMALAMWFALRRFGLRHALLVPAAAAVAAGARGVKLVLGPTPFYDELSPWTVSGNLPSGHTSYATAVFGLLAVYALMAHRRDLAVALCLPVVAMGPALVLDGSHVPSDVLAGYAFGTAWTMALLALALPKPVAETTA